MKVHELLSTRILLEDVTLDSFISSPRDLIDPKTGKYYTGVVNVSSTFTSSSVHLRGEGLTEFPVKFGKIDGIFECGMNKLTSLKDGPREVGGDFICNRNILTTLEHAPREVGGNFECNANLLTTLEGIHKIVKRIGKRFSCYENDIKSGGIGLILIEDLKLVYGDSRAFGIINKYLGQGKKGLLLCQEELIERGFEEYARL